MQSFHKSTTKLQIIVKLTSYTLLGPKGLQIYNSITYNQGEDENDVALIIEKLENIIVGQTNVIYERYVFNNRNQREDENIDSYVAELRRLSKTCQFCDCLQSSLIRDHLVIYIKDSATRKYLLQKRDLTLENAIDICRGSEATAAHLKGIGGYEAEKVFKNYMHATSFNLESVRAIRVSLTVKIRMKRRRSSANFVGVVTS